MFSALDQKDTSVVIRYRPKVSVGQVLSEQHGYNSALPVTSRWVYGCVYIMNVRTSLRYDAAGLLCSDAIL